MIGRNVYIKEINSNVDLLDIDLSLIKQGIYTFNLIVGERNNFIGKISIVR